ncbi:MAG TPA: FAD-dependent monooxygenase, partial [Saprospiraceae bacterium]|nr:FAD-dependent monooxygenase [Saprospiraceae bacterium]
MIPAVDYRLKPEEKDLQEAHLREICIQLDRPLDSDIHFRVVRRNIDARGRQVWYVFRAEVLEQEAPSEPNRRFDYQQVGDRPEVHIVGAGPCGYFAALQLLEYGLKPVVLERGKDVRARRRDLRNIQQFGLVDPDSNYCFGEGGAGTYSDGKLYTRADKRGDVKKVIEILIHHGANPEIRIDVHPHIGSNKLPDIIANIRETIRSHGGEVHFETRVEDFVFENGRLSRLITQDREIPVQHCILATGHSARNIYETLYRREIELEEKPFALGVRVEHPQSVIDEIQYHQKQRDPNLPAASYSLTCQVAERGVFSFCMCP